MNRRKRIGVAAVVLAAGAAIGCASTGGPTMTDLEPTPLASFHRVAVAETQRPTVALVLGGGGLRGFAHVGVLRALEEAGIKPDLVVGTSAGAVVGAAYASGLTVDQIEAAALNVKVSSLIDWTWSGSGLMRGENIAKWIGTLTTDAPIESFPVRFAAVATDLETGRAVILDKGRAGRAIQASAAVPGVTVPVAYPGGHLVDGGIASLVPVRAARAMGADIVIAVDIYCHGPRAQGLGALKVIGRTMQTQNCLVAAPEMAEADVLIAPDVGVPGMSARDEQVRAIREGYAAARQALAARRE